ncbi:hypothetical protein SEA_RAHALELUJAH_71 [Mycobacterium phage Rahalelujah]|nr:hypothetical protein SEA_RAHALELUJAH_71 [Mycobacterium phage Rahalelujah]
MKIKLSKKEAVIVKAALAKHQFEASWYRHQERDVCANVVTRIGRKLDTHHPGG